MGPWWQSQRFAYQALDLGQDVHGVLQHLQACVWGWGCWRVLGVGLQARIRGLALHWQQYDDRLFFVVSELMDLLLTGEDQSRADQPNTLAEGHPM